MIGSAGSTPANFMIDHRQNVMVSDHEMFNAADAPGEPDSPQNVWCMWTPDASRRREPTIVQFVESPPPFSVGLIPPEPVKRADWIVTTTSSSAPGANDAVLYEVVSDADPFETMCAAVIATGQHPLTAPAGTPPAVREWGRGRTAIRRTCT